MSTLARILATIGFVVFGVSTAKAAQYASVDAFAPVIGFDLASFAGAAPVVGGLALLLRFFPRINKMMIGHG